MNNSFEENFYDIDEETSFPKLTNEQILRARKYFGVTKWDSIKLSIKQSKPVRYIVNTFSSKPKNNYDLSQQNPLIQAWNKIGETLKDSNNSYFVKSNDLKSTQSNKGLEKIVIDQEVVSREEMLKRIS